MNEAFYFHGITNKRGPTIFALKGSKMALFEPFLQAMKRKNAVICFARMSYL